MEYRDYYKILGLERTANADQVRTAYRRLARKFNPDVSKEKNAEALQVQEVRGARDTEKRAAYDQLGDGGSRVNGFARRRTGAAALSFRRRRRGRPRRRTYRQRCRGAGSQGDFSDFFSSLFGGRPPSPAAAAARARDHHARASTSARGGLPRRDAHAGCAGPGETRRRRLGPIPCG
jgi:curved DNA-binding protein